VYVPGVPVDTTTAESEEARATLAFASSADFRPSALNAPVYVLMETGSVEAAATVTVNEAYF